MLESLKQAGRNVGQELGRAWGNISEGWHELLSRSSGALTHFTHPKGEAGASAESLEGSAAIGGLSTLPRWSLLAGEVEETASDVVVRVEMPGMEKENCRIVIRDNTLYLSGEKHFERESHDSDYHVMERAYGAFQRVFPLPHAVNPDKAEATYRNGVLTVRLPKEGASQTRVIPVS